MNNINARDALIRSLSQDLPPVEPLSAGRGRLLIVAATLVATAFSIAVFGFWPGMLTGEASGFFWIVNGLLLVVGAASAAALVASAMPRVGQRSDAPLWMAAILAVVPVAAILTLLPIAGADPLTAQASHALFYWECAIYALAAGLIVAVAATAFLRRGAPVSIERSGWLTGLAAGALGSLAYGITCPIDGLAHVGLIHIAPVAISAVLGRIAVPPLIRW